MARAKKAPEADTTPEVHPSGVAFMDEFKVLVRPDDVIKKTAGGVIIPEVAQKEFEVHTGTLELVSDDAFSYHIKTNSRCPKIGDRVLMAKYAGVALSEKFTKDGRAYRILNDRDILCTITF